MGWIASVVKIKYFFSVLFLGFFFFIAQVGYAQTEEDILNSVGNELESEAEKAKEEARIEKEYTALKSKAESAYKGKKYDKAKSYYAEMLKLKPDSEFANGRVALIDQLIEQQAQAELEKKYNELITQADALLAAEKWADAITKYKAAAAADPSQEYPQNQIKKVVTLEAEKKAAQAAAAKQAKYDEAISKAEQAKTAKNWEVAKQQYGLALKIKADESYPQQQLVLVETLQAEEAAKAKQMALDKKYNFLVDAGDKALAEKDWDVAKAKFKLAMEAKPTESDAKQKYNSVDRLKAEYEAAQAKEKLDREYKAMIVKADQSFASNKWSEAIASYKQAQGLKPAETYPNAQISTAESKIKAEAEAEKKAAELETEFSTQLKIGEEALANEKWQLAIEAFVSAKALKPQNTKVTGLLDQAKSGKKKSDELALKKKAEAEAAAKLQKQFDSEMSTGAAALSAKNWQEARAAFTSAKKLKPEDGSPTEKLLELDQLVAKEKAEKEAADKLAAQKAAEEEAARLAAEQAEQARIAEEKRVAEEARIAEENKRKEEEAARLAAEKAEQERLAAEKAKKEEQDRLNAAAAEAKRFAMMEAEKAEKEEQARLAAEEEKRLAEAAAVAEAKRLEDEAAAEAERLAQEKADQEKKEEEARLAKEQEKLAAQQAAEEDQKRLEQEAAAKAKEEAELAAAEAKKQEEAAANEARKKEGFQNAVREYEKAISESNWNEASKAISTAVSVYPSNAKVAEMQSELTQLQQAAEKELANQRAAEEKAKALEAAYNGAIKNGDAALANKSYKDAESAFKEAERLKPAADYPKNKLIEIKELVLAENEAQFAIQQELDKKYSAFLAKGEAAMKNKNWEEATTAFTAAQKVKPEKQGPKERIAEIERLIQKEKDLLAQAAALEEDYKDRMKNGNTSLNNQKFAEAKRFFMGASKLKPEASEPKEKLAETDKLWTQFTEAEKAAEAEKKAQQLEDNYKGFIMSGDQSFQSQNWEQAIKNYQGAIGLKPGATYPTEKLLAAKKQQQKAIELAEKEREEEVARQKAIEAERLQKEKEAARLAKMEADFSQAMNNGDDAMASNSFKVAVTEFSKAVRLKPDNSSAKSKLETAKTKFQENEAVRLAKEKERQRLATIELKKKQEEARIAREAYMAELLKNSPEELAKRYPNGITEEVENTDERIVTKSIIVENNEGRYLLKFSYPWGEEFYYLNGKKIRADAYNWNIRKFKF